ncbi:hypothetical protein WDW86_01985 [Bdellovibrionota bacterium FG-2]
MKKSNSIYETLQMALPESFPFYHLGEVTKLTPALPHEKKIPVLAPSDELKTIGYSLQGDFQGVLLVQFDRSLDFSVYAEMGNIIASQLVTTLSARKEMDLAVSPPQKISKSVFQSLLKVGKDFPYHQYIHKHGNVEVTVHAWIILTSSGDRGHA